VAPRSHNDLSCNVVSLHAASSISAGLSSSCHSSLVLAAALPPPTLPSPPKPPPRSPCPRRALLLRKVPLPQVHAWLLKELPVPAHVCALRINDPSRGGCSRGRHKDIKMTAAERDCGRLCVRKAEGYSGDDGAAQAAHRYCQAVIYRGFFSTLLAPLFPFYSFPIPNRGTVHVYPKSYTSVGLCRLGPTERR